MDQKKILKMTGQPTITLLFAFLSLLMAADTSGWFGPSASILVSIMQIAVWPTYMTAAFKLIESGDGFLGNTFLYFSVFFAFIPGLTGLFRYFADHNGCIFDDRILGIQWIMIGLVLLFSLPAFARINRLLFTINFISVPTFFILGAQTFHLIGNKILTGYCTISLGLVGVGAAYIAVIQLLNYADFMFIQEETKIKR